MHYQHASENEQKEYGILFTFMYIYTHRSKGKNSNFHTSPIFQLLLMTPSKLPRISTNLLPIQPKSNFKIQHGLGELTDFSRSECWWGTIVIGVGVVFEIELGEGVGEPESCGVGFGFGHS
jgi:hypothetical protein